MEARVTGGVGIQRPLAPDDADATADAGSVAHCELNPAAMTSESPMLKISEIFESLQGEGVSIGAPCIFVRLAQCNLHCTWCDTKYTWDFERYRYEDEVREQPVAEVAQIVN